MSRIFHLIVFVVQIQFIFCADLEHPHVERDAKLSTVNIDNKLIFLNVFELKFSS